METKFTKGPWDWEYDNDTSSIIQVFSISSDAKGDPDICRIQSEGNAHLIAAAPEMYEMLEELTGILSQDATHVREAYISYVDELLAKARGEK